MDNASDALIMAGSVLIFIIALTVCISSFTTLRVGIDDIVGQTETVEMAKNDKGYINYIDSKNAGAVRVVGSETVVSSMYRALKENYVIYIVADDTKYNTWGLNTTNINNVSDDKINLKNCDYELKVKNTKNEIKYINPNHIIKVTIGNEYSNTDINKKLGKGFYQSIKEDTFYEYLGEYQNNSNAATTSENKQTKRIITYIEKSYLDKV